MNYIEEAKRHLTAAYDSESSAANHFERENAKTIALIAIAEQLRISNLLKLCNIKDHSESELEEIAHKELFIDNVRHNFATGYRPDIAEALGLKEES